MFHLDPVIIAQLGNLELRARRILDGFYAGHHVNRNRGHAQDFSEHRPYNPGDDLRGMDWKVFGRTDRLVIKQYEEQTNVQATVMLDNSSSMAFSHNGRISKLEYAKTLAAAIGTLVISQTDAIGLIAGRETLSPGSQRGHLSRFFESLENISADGVWDGPAAAKDYQSRNRRHGFVIVISDLMSNDDGLINSLRMLQAQRNEVLVLQVLDPAEIDLPFEGPAVFEDLETGEKIKTEPSAIRGAYISWVKAHLAAQSHLLRSVGVEHLLLQSDTPFDKGLGAYLSWRGMHL